MRALSFLFAALLGLTLAMMAPALAGPRPEAAQAPLPAAVLATEFTPGLPAESASEPSEASAIDTAALGAEETLSVEQISRSILEAIGADAA
jgi:hypothetical protein